jgi:hypothetical protein
MKVSLFWFPFCIVHSSSAAGLELVDAKWGFEDSVELSLMVVI